MTSPPDSAKVETKSRGASRIFAPSSGSHLSAYKAIVVRVDSDRLYKFILLGINTYDSNQGSQMARQVWVWPPAALIKTGAKFMVVYGLRNVPW